MQLLRQLGAQVAAGALTALSQTNDYADQVVDVPSRMIMQLAASGKMSRGFGQVAAAGIFAIPLPQAYVTTNMLHVAFATDQTLKLAWVDASGTRTAMVRAGLAADQPGLLVFCGAVTSLTITNSAAVAANVEWLLFELPAITTNAGWRDGSLATGLSAP